MDEQKGGGKGLATAMSGQSKMGLQNSTKQQQKSKQLKQTNQKK
jgi:hypothetical protein